MIAAPVRAAAATRRTHSGSPDWADGAVSGQEGPDAAAGGFGAVAGSGSLGDSASRSRARGGDAGGGGDVATESRSLPLRESREDIHTPPPPAKESERAAAHLP